MRVPGRLLLLCSAVSVGWGCADGRALGDPRAPLGTWGGEHIRLEVTSSGATVEYDCAHGTVDEPIALDAEGRFAVEGTHVPESGGPQRDGEQLPVFPARFTGRVDGRTMRLTVTLVEGGVVGTFRLAHGGAGRLLKCL
ncbi:MAG TPA: hypothetical protein VMR21_07790 [Vicinamibacteria bacterium]|nr:hypothetical protein [Vicinamibacteria bacterium]